MICFTKMILQANFIARENDNKIMFDHFLTNIKDVSLIEIVKILILLFIDEFTTILTLAILNCLLIIPVMLMSVFDVVLHLSALQ